MAARLLLDSLTFSDGTEISTADANIIALVGPNNSGKSSTLREINGRAALARSVGPVLLAAEFKKEGSETDIKLWLEQNVPKVNIKYGRGLGYAWFGTRGRQPFSRLL